MENLLKNLQKDSIQVTEESDPTQQKTTKTVSNSIQLKRILNTLIQIDLSMRIKTTLEEVEGAETNPFIKPQNLSE